MKDINDIFLDGEKVIWSGVPDPGLAKPLAPYWRRKLVHFLWLLLFTLVFLALFELETRIDRDGMLDNVLTVVAILILIGVLFGSAAFFDFKDSAEDPSKQSYVLTDQRLVVMLRNGEIKKQIFANSALAIETYKKQAPARINIFFGQSESDFVSLVGLLEIDRVEKMIIQTLAPRSSE